MDLLNQFKDFLFSQKDLPAKVTVKNYLSDVNHFIRWYEKEFNKSFSPKLITHQTIEQYKKTNSETFSQSSMDRHLSSLRKFFYFLKIEGIIASDPFKIENLKLKIEPDPWHIKDFKNYLYVYNASHLTIKNYIIDTRQFFTWAENVTGANDTWNTKDKNILNKIDNSLLEEYKNRLVDEGNFSPSTVNRKLSSLRKYLNWATEEKLLGNSEFRIQNLELNRTDARNVRLELESLRSRSQGVNPWVDGSSSNTSNFPPQEFGKPNYSGFPPLRLIQKISKIGIFAFDQFLTLPFTKAFDKVSYLAWLAKGKPIFKKVSSRKYQVESIGNRSSELKSRILNTKYLILNTAPKVKNLPKEFYAPLDISTKYFPWYKKAWHNLRYRRPKWYETYHSYPITHYFHFAVLVIFMAVIGFGFYQSFFQKPTAGQPVLAAFPNAPIRILSFQGRLTDNFDNPISTPSALRFAIYNAQAPATGSALLWQEVDSVSPDQDGIFAVLLGNAGNCPVGQTNPTGPCGIPPWLFASNSALFLGVSVNTTPEMTPRQQLATVAFAANSELLQGLPPITQSGAGTSNVVLALDSSGNLTIGGAANPTFQASGGQFTISGQPLLLTTNTGSNGNIQLAPDGTGFIDLAKPIVNTSNSNNIASAVGSVEIDDLLSVLATSSGQSALTINQTGGGPLISASASGVAKFTVDNNGNLGLAGSFPSSSNYITTPNFVLNTSGQITTGAWQATAVGALYGGTGINTSGSTGVPYISSGTWAATSGLGTSSQCLTGGATPSWGACGGVNWWNQLAGALSPIDTTNDFLLGSTATSSALFSYTGIKTGQTIASLSGQLIVMANNGWGGNATISGALTLGAFSNGIIQTTRNQGLTIGGNTTGQITLSALNGTQNIRFAGYTTAGCTLKADTSGLLTCGTDNSGGGSPFSELLGAIVPNNSTEDFLIGGQSTASAKFSVTGISNLSNQINASLSGQLIVMANNGWGGNATISGALTLGAFSNGIIQTTRNQALTLGGNTTGGILINQGTNTAAAIIIGGSSQTGTLTLGSSSGTNSILIANGAGATTLNLANVQVGGAVNIGAAMTTGTISIGGTGLQTGTIDIGIGTGAQTINLGTGGTGAKAINIGTGAINNTLIIGSVTTTAATTLRAGTGDLTLSSTDQLFANSSKASGGTTTEALSIKSTADLGVLDELLQIGDSAADFLTILGNGNVGIGTTTPTSNLQISGGYGSNALLSLNQLNSGDIFTASASGTTRLTLNNAGQLQLATTGSTGGLTIGTDTQIYRSGTNQLSLLTSGTAWLNLTSAGRLEAVNGGWIRGTGTTTASHTLESMVSGDTNVRLAILGSGTIQWGDGTSTWDTNLYRSAANTLMTDDSFTAAGGNITFSTFTSNGGVLYTNGSGVLAQATAGSTTDCLIGGTTPSFSSCASAAASSIYWTQNLGALYPKNSTVDMLVGGTSTAAAQFSVTGINNNHAVASVSGNLIVMANNGWGGNVGIGTTNPTTYLAGTSGLSVYHATVPGIALANGSGSWLTYMTGTDYRLFNGAADKFTIQNGGNVGIGNLATGGYKLDVTPNATTGTGLRILDNASNPGVQLLAIGDDSFFTDIDVANTLGLYGVSDTTIGSLKLGSGGGTISGYSGNVGIGTTTPDSGFHVIGGVCVESSDSACVASTGTIRAQQFIDRDNTSYFLDPAATSTSLIVLGGIAVGTTSPLAATGLHIDKNTLGNTAVIINQLGSGNLITGSASGTTNFLVKNNGDTVIGPGGAGKLTVTTLDPLYTIDGTRYSTYAPSMTGVKEEVTGKATLTYNPTRQSYSYTINLNEQEVGSDLWLFSRVIDTDVSLTSVLLTPDSSAKVWYEKDAVARSITFFADRPTSLSYRLTAPRFDHEKWANLSDETDPGITGLIAPPAPDSTSTIAALLNNASASGNLNLDSEFKIAETLDNTGNTSYSLVDSFGNAIKIAQSFSDVLIANIQAGYVHAQALTVAGFISAKQISTDSLAVITDNVTIGGQSLRDYIAGVVSDVISNLASQGDDLRSYGQIISPIASIDEVHTNLISPLAQDSSISLKLDNNQLSIINNQSGTGSAVATFDNAGNATFSGQLSASSGQFGDASISGTLRAGRIIASEIEGFNSAISNQQLATSSPTYITNNYYASTSSATSIQPSASSSATDGSLLAASGYIDISSYSGQFNNVDNLIANTATFTQGLMSFGPSSFSDVSVVGQLSIDGNLILAGNSINVLGGDLQIQPLKQGGLSVMAGLFYIDTNGNIKVGGNAEFAKDVRIAGTLSTNIISPIPGNDLTFRLATSNQQLATSSGILNTRYKIQNTNGLDVLSVNQLGDLVASGAGTFSKLNLGLVSPAFALSNTEVIATGSAGTGTINAGRTQMTINNKLVTQNSLIYITPTTSTNQPLFLLRQEPNVSFTVGVQIPSLTPIQFNWIIVN